MKLKMFCLWGLIKDTILCFDGSYYLVYTLFAIQKAIDMEIIGIKSNYKWHWKFATSIFLFLSLIFIP
jgi:hypothetical protein